METNRIDIADNFFGMIKNLSAEVKLDLITKISNSLKIKMKDMTRTAAAEYKRITSPKLFPTII